MSGATHNPLAHVALHIGLHLGTDSSRLYPSLQTHWSGALQTPFVQELQIGTQLKVITICNVNVDLSNETNFTWFGRPFRIP